MLNFDAPKICSCGKHCEKKEKLLVTSNFSFNCKEKLLVTSNFSFNCNPYFQHHTKNTDYTSMCLNYFKVLTWYILTARIKPLLTGITLYAVFQSISLSTRTTWPRSGLFRRFDFAFRFHFQEPDTRFFRTEKIGTCIWLVISVYLSSLPVAHLGIAPSY